MQTSIVINSAVAIRPIVIQPVANTPWMPSLLRTFARRWDLIGILSLMSSSAAYGVYALMHIGF